MSGTVVNNVARASGTIAATPGGLDWSADVVTASTVTVEAGRGYFINTTSNACTITLPASAEIGDQIVIADYARTWATNAVTLDSNGLNFQGNDDTYTVNYETVGQSLNIVFSDSTQGWLPVSDDAVADVPVTPALQRAAFAFGETSSAATNLKNLVNTVGVVSADVTGVGSARLQLSGATYGGDKGIFAFGSVHKTNLMSNLGVIAADVTGTGTNRKDLQSAAYGNDKAIYAFGGNHDSLTSVKNLVSNVGVVAEDATGVGTARRLLAAVGYGGDKAAYAYGVTASPVSLKNLVSNSGVVAADVSGVGTARYDLAAARYGGDKALFAYGNIYSGGNVYYSMKNLMSNTGVISADVTGVGDARTRMAAAGYGGDKAIFAFGHDGSSVLSAKNLVNNVGVVAATASGVGTARQTLAAASYQLG